MAPSAWASAGHLQLAVSNTNSRLRPFRKPASHLPPYLLNACVTLPSIQAKHFRSSLSLFFTLYIQSSGKSIFFYFQNTPRRDTPHQLYRYCPGPRGTISCLDYYKSLTHCPCSHSYSYYNLFLLQLERHPLYQIYHPREQSPPVVSALSSGSQSTVWPVTSLPTPLFL